MAKDIKKVIPSRASESVPSRQSDSGNNGGIKTTPGKPKKSKD